MILYNTYIYIYIYAFTYYSCQKLIRLCNYWWHNSASPIYMYRLMHIEIEQPTEEDIYTEYTRQGRRCLKSDNTSKQDIWSRSPTV